MSDNLEFFRETAERILSDTVGTADILAAADRQLPTRMFDALRDNGILAMLAPESAGGIGATLAEAMAILRAAGDAAAPGPLLETMLAHALLGAAGREAPGEPVSMVLLPAGLPQGDAASTYIAPWAGQVGQILLVAPRDGGSVIAVTTPSAWQITPGEDAAGEPSDIISTTGEIAAELVSLAMPFDEVLRLAAILRGGQMLGAMEWAYRRSVEYAMERQQFGREIGRFQAVQQMLADLADHLLAATVLLEAAAQGSSMMMVGAARSRLADATDCAISVAHQVHGAIGFSLEYALNHRTRRLMAWRDTYGSTPSWRRSLGRMLASCNRDNLWHQLTGTQTAA